MAIKLYLHEDDVEFIKALLSSHEAIDVEDKTQEMAQQIVQRIEAQEAIGEWEREATQIPETYAEIEYSDMESEEAVRGCAFDDMNFLRYFER